MNMLAIEVVFEISAVQLGLHTDNRFFSLLFRHFGCLF